MNKLIPKCINLHVANDISEDSIQDLDMKHQGHILSSFQHLSFQTILNFLLALSEDLVYFTYINLLEIGKKTKTNKQKHATPCLMIYKMLVYKILKL